MNAAAAVSLPEVVAVPGWPTPKGYANGMVAEGRLLAIAGQIGWDPAGVFVSDELLPQLAQALDNVLAIVRAAGGEPSSITQMTIFVTDMAAYRACLRALGPVWKERFGRHYPAMALMGVTELVEPQAKVEVIAWAVLTSK
jgi:enamine deaminase RidA (YjgF/YER057c/UK114 family)